MIDVLGVFTVYSNGKKIAQIKNKITDGGLSVIAKRVGGVAASELTHLAAGSDGTTVTGTETELGEEFGRVSKTAQSVAGPILSVSFVALEGELNGNIQELGIYAGDVLFNRVLWSHAKTNAEQLTFNYTLTVGRA